jgi:hypothetical protein
MRSLVPSAVGAALCLATLLPAVGAAEDAVWPDGSHRPGVLTFSSGRLQFQPDGSTAALPLADLHAVRCITGPLSPLLAGRVHRVLLPHGQLLTGQILDLDEQRLRLRTVWADRLSIPRGAVTAVTQLPGSDVFFAPEFAADLKGWTRTGNPALGEQRSPAGQRCLMLERPDHSVAHVLAEPLAAGWFAVDFQVAEASGAVEADFGGRAARVVLAGDGYRVEVPGVPGTTFRLVPTPGWHRLRLDFAPERLAVTIDDTAVWSADGRGPGGALRQVRLACTAGPGDRRGAVAFADVCLARPLPDVPHPPGDPRQDEVWLTSGDQVFGRVPRADEHHVELTGRLGTRTLSWGAVRGVFLRDGGPAPPSADGASVRVWLAHGAGEGHDELVGTVRALDERWLVLEHPLLGECKVPRGRLRRLSAGR